jgi:hypothetical protein
MTKQTTETIPVVEHDAALEVSENFADGATPNVEPNHRPAGLEIVIRPRTVTRVLLVVVAIVAVTGTIANLVIYQVAPTPDHKIARLMQRFDLGHEPSIPALYSSIALLAASVLLLTIGVAKRNTRDRFAYHWLALAAIFLVLAIDEAVMFHEMLVNSMRDAFQLGGIFFFPWVIPAMFAVLIVGLLYLRFLAHLEPRTRWLFVAAATLFVGGAVGMEMVAGVIIEEHGVATVGDASSEVIEEVGAASIRHTIVQTIEESLEMLGVVVFIYALLDYLGRHVGLLRLRILGADAGRPTEGVRGNRPAKVIS